ncbi:MAG: hypothetical protein ABH824_03630 [Nanoarchaeota archaeon]
MLGFKREYGIGKNLATGVCYLAVADFIQSQFTGQYISDHLGTRITDIPGWVTDTGVFLTGLLARYNFSRMNKSKNEKIDYTPIKKLDDLKE